MKVGTESPQPSALFRHLPGAKRMRLSHYGEVRALSRIAEQAQRPEEKVFWRNFGRGFTLVEIDGIEIITPNVQIENGPNMYLDEDTARRLYALAWERFEQALVNVNALYNETPDEGQTYAFNRVKRLLWEVDDLKQFADAVFQMIAIPEGIDDEGAYSRDA